MFKAEQVLYWNITEKKYLMGIMFGDIVICACCGDGIHKKQIINSTPEGKEPIIRMRDWKSFEEYIHILYLE